MDKKSRIIAHRGYWKKNGAAQNSIASLRNAGDARIFGTEFDVRITKDLVPVVHHDPEIDGLIISELSFSDLRYCRIANGELVPSLDEYLECAIEYPCLNLFLELKPCESADLEDKFVKKVISVVKNYDLMSRLEFISFSPNICGKIRCILPDISVSLICKEMSPEKVRQTGVTGVDYEYKVLKRYPEWIGVANQLGLSVNTWVVNSGKMIRFFSELGADYITTDYTEYINKLTCIQVFGIDNL